MVEGMKHDGFSLPGRGVVPSTVNRTQQIGYLRCCGCPRLWLSPVCPAQLGDSARRVSRTRSVRAGAAPGQLDGSEVTSMHGSKPDQQPKQKLTHQHPLPGHPGGTFPTRACCFDPQRNRNQ